MSFIKKRSKLNASPLTQTEEFVFKMLAYELNNVPLPPTPADMNWDKLLELAKRHAIMPLLYSAAKVMSDVPDKILQTFRSAAIASAMNNERKLTAQDEVLKLLESNGIKCAVLKGSSCAVYYPHPELRQMGDIDILIEPDELEIVHELVQTIGYVYQEHQHEFHRGYTKAANQSYIEIHYAISEFPSREKAQLTKQYMENALEHIHVVTIGEHSIPVLDDEYQAISLLVHMERHMFNGEIGLRQLSDWAMLAKSTGNFGHTLLESIGMAVFVDTLNAICSERLCLSVREQDSGDRTLVLATTNKLISGGNLKGTHEQAMSHSFTKARPSSDNWFTNNTLARYIANIRNKVKHEFPQFNQGILLPFYCVYYPIRWWSRVLIGKRKRVSPVGVWNVVTNEKNFMMRWKYMNRQRNSLIIKYESVWRYSLIEQ